MARKRSQVATSGYRILVVDDQQEILTSVGTLLEREGHEVLLAGGAAEALELFGRHPVHLMLVDYFMPRMTGEELIAEIRKIDTDVQIVLLTGYSGEKPPREMLRRLDIQGYHDKTDGPERLLLWIEVALKAHEQLRRVRDSELTKSHLLANISHELRTPIHIILGYSEVLGGEPSPSVDRVPLDGIRTNAQALLRLVNDFIHLADLEHGVSRSERDDVCLADFEEEFTTRATNSIRDKPVRFVWTIGRNLPHLAADPAKVRVILANLLSNAVKFTREGAVTVSADVGAETASIDVRDTGIGIAPEDHERIFEAFRQLDGSNTRACGGLGIGLALARKLARLMGGDVTVDSTVGSGATFTITLPSARGVPGPPLTADASQPAGS